MDLSRLSLIATAFTREQMPPPDEGEAVFAGRSNVGKSSVLNRLAGEPLRSRSAARVSQQPGCTRSLNFYQVRGMGRLVDFPGYGYARWDRETGRRVRDLIDGYFQDRPHPKVLVQIVDARLPIQKLDLALLEWAKNIPSPHLFVLNKCDKVSRSELKQRRDEALSALKAFGPTPEIVAVSALTNEGISELKMKVRDYLA